MGHDLSCSFPRSIAIPNTSKLSDLSIAKLATIESPFYFLVLIVIVSIFARIEALTKLQLMLKTIEGIYQNGQIQLASLPQDISDRSQVLVTFLDPNKIDPIKLRQLIDQLETIAGIQQGFEELNAGLTRPIGNFVQEMQQKYDISG